MPDSNAFKPLPGEKSIALPARKLLAAPMLISACCAFGWYLLVRSFDLFQPGDDVGGLVGSSLTGVLSVLSIFAISPWKTRPVSLWASAWLAATVIRFLVTPIAAYLLYSASHFNAKALALSVTITYCACLAGEVGVLSLYLRRVA